MWREWEDEDDDDDDADDYERTMTMTLREQLGVIKVLRVSRPSHRLKHASVSQ